MREILRVAGLEGTERKGSEVAKENKVYVSANRAGVVR